MNTETGNETTNHPFEVPPSPSGYVQILPDGTYDVLSPAGESLLGPFGGPFHTSQAAEGVQRMFKAFDAINGTIREINNALRTANAN